jgi:glycosyltransferase involved in cell wall biosynthesis
MTDAVLLNQPPVDVMIFSPNNWEGALDFNQVVITGTDALDPWAMTQLAKKNPVVLVHHKQTRTRYRAELINSARMLICHTPRHLEIEKEWTEPKNSTWILSHHNTEEFQVKPKLDFALWAGRWHYQKGPDEAIKWAEERNLKLLMFRDKPRSEVLEAMSIAKYFVFLPNEFDAEPRAVIEAVLSGCEVHTNELAGISSVPNWRNPETLINLVSNAKQFFWDRVLE